MIELKKTLIYVEYVGMFFDVLPAEKFKAIHFENNIPTVNKIKQDPQFSVQTEMNASFEVLNSERSILDFVLSILRVNYVSSKAKTSIFFWSLIHLIKTNRWVRKQLINVLRIFCFGYSESCFIRLISISSSLFLKPDVGYNHFFPFHTTRNHTIVVKIIFGLKLDVDNLHPDLYLVDNIITTHNDEISKAIETLGMNENAQCDVFALGTKNELQAERKIRLNNNDHNLINCEDVLSVAA